MIFEALLKSIMLNFWSIIASCLDKISNPRLCNLKEKTLRYHFRMVHIPGVKNRAPDAISRHPTGDQTPPKMQLLDDDDFHISHPELSPSSFSSLLVYNVKINSHQMIWKVL